MLGERVGAFECRVRCEVFDGFDVARVGLSENAVEVIVEGVDALAFQ